MQPEKVIKLHFLSIIYYLITKLKPLYVYLHDCFLKMAPGEQLDELFFLCTYILTQMCSLMYVCM